MACKKTTKKPASSSVRKSSHRKSQDKPKLSEPPIASVEPDEPPESIDSVGAESHIDVLLEPDDSPAQQKTEPDPIVSEPIQTQTMTPAPKAKPSKRFERIRTSVLFYWQHQHGWKKSAVYVGVGVCVLMLLGGVSMGVAYAHRPVKLSNIRSQAYDQPVRIVFTKPVKKNITYAWQEKVEGTWKSVPVFGGVGSVVFTPKTHLAPGAVLHARLANVSPVIGIMTATDARQTVTVTVESAASITGITPAASAVDVLVATDISVTLSAANRHLRQLELAGGLPLKDKRPSSSDDKTFVWKLATPLSQGQAYRADIIDTNQPPGKQTIGAISFTTVYEPQASSDFTGYILPGSVVAIDFDRDMEQGTQVVRHDIPGKGAWANPRKYTIVAGAVTPGKTYRYTVLKGTKSTVGGVVSEDSSFTVRAPGPAQVIGSRPGGTRIALDAPISLTFDQPVDRASAEAAFNITPQVKGTFAWSGNTMTFRPEGYGYQTTYTYGVAEGIKPVFGLPGAPYGARFTTVYEIKKLSVPYFAQVHALSCEAASLRMALGYYGIGTSDDEILGRIGYNPQPRNLEANSWQDPNQMFVGDVDGVMSKTGWGVYAAPVARVARSFGRGAEVLYGPSSAQVAAAIHAGNPVVIWGVSAGAAPIDDSWNTETSGVVHAAKNQHVRIVYGVEGSADNPVGFYIHDPIRRAGSVYWTAGALQYNMNGGGRQALVVR